MGERLGRSGFVAEIDNTLVPKITAHLSALKQVSQTYPGAAGICEELEDNATHLLSFLREVRAEMHGSSEGSLETAQEE